MNDAINLSIPSGLFEMEKNTRESGFTMGSEYRTGSLLRNLVATKRKAKILELGTGTGLSAYWLLQGMDKNSKLITVDNDPKYVEIAKKYLSYDHRIEFCIQDGSEFLRGSQGQKFDLIFADTWPGKFWDLDLALNLLCEGGIYIVDDLLPQPNWAIDHAPKVDKLIKELECKSGFVITKMCWSTGIIIMTKI